MSQKTEAHLMNFDLSHLGPDHEFTLLAGGGRRYALQRYADHPSKLDEHVSTLTHLQAVPESHLPKLTHFVEDAQMDADKATLRKIIFPSLDDHPLPEIAAVFLHTPQAHVLTAVHRMRKAGTRPRAHVSAVHLGMDPEAFDEMVTGLSPQEHAHRLGDWNKTKTVVETATAIALHHPELGSVQPGIMEVVKQTYLNPLGNQNMQDFIAYLQQSQPGTGAFVWYNKSWSKWAENPHETDPKKVNWVPAEADTTLKFKGGGTPKYHDAPGGVGYKGLAIYNLTDEYDPPQGNPKHQGVVEAGAPTVRAALLGSKNQIEFAGQLWNSQQGVTNTAPGQPPARPPAGGGTQPQHAMMEAAAVYEAQSAAAMAATGAKGFAVKNKTSTYGLYTYDIAYDAGTKMLTVPVKNWPSRYLGAYVQFLKEDGAVIKRADLSYRVNGQKKGWPDMLPFDLVEPLVQRSDSKNYLVWLSSGSAIFGAPVPPLTQKTELSFPWPEQASRAMVMMGGLGVAEGFKDWDTDVDLVGVLGTGIINYGFGALSMALGVYVVNPFIKMLQKEWGFGFYAVAFFIGAPLLLVGVVERDNKWGKMILSKLSGIAAGALFGAIVKKAILKAAEDYIAKYIEAQAISTAEMSAEEAAEEVPYVGWALRVVSMAADLAALTATTVECLASPATYEIEVIHTMDLTVTVHPDPTHGKDGFPSNWPVVADHYVVQVKYPGAHGQQGGTTYTKAGPMPGDPSGAVTVVFKGIPAGGTVEVIAGVYSDSNWLAGQWNSGWLDGVPDSNDEMQASGSIVERLVPLTDDTTYGQKRAMGYTDALKHYWQNVTFSVASTLVPDLDKGDAPDQAIQKAFADNGDTLTAKATIAVTTPGRHWTLTDTGLGAEYDIALKQIYAGSVFQMPAGTAGDLDKGGSPDSTVLNAFHAAQYPLPTTATVPQITVVTAGSKWTIGLAGVPPMYELTLSGSQIDVVQTLHELEVNNTAQAVPALPESYPLSPAASGNSLGKLINIVHNNSEFQLGYSYLAAGQGLPYPWDPKTPIQSATYAIQSVSTLGQPQEQIFQPEVAYDAPVFIAYDQFGLTPLFVMDEKLQAGLKDGPLSSDVAAEFAKFGHTLPGGAIVKSITAGKDWAVGAPNKTPLFEIRVTQTKIDTKTVNQLSVYDYPVPALDNFFLEPQQVQGTETREFYLKAVNLDTAPGEYTFDTGNNKIWGRFANGSNTINSNDFDEVTIHPNGYAIALDNLNGKLFVLKLPAESSDVDQAPLAMPLSGLGSREGLMDGPSAMNVTADGRILVLETGTTYIEVPRIQAFDTKGNPVPSFGVGQPSAEVPNATALITELDAVEVGTDLMALFQKSFDPGLAPKAIVDDVGTVAKISSDLDAGKVNQALIDELAAAGFAKVDQTDPKDDSTPADFTVAVTEAGKLWYVSDTTSQQVFDMRIVPGDWGDTLDVFLAPTVSVTIKAAGAEWKLSDTTNALTYGVTKAAKSDTVTIQRLCSWMPLRAQSVTGTLSYLDLSSETMGYIYVLSVIDNNYNTTKKPEDLTFQLDIYEPDGTPLLKAPQSGINAGKITVDQYRTLYTLNYQPFLGPNNRTEPGVSQWAPSTPVVATPGVG